jgi:hypothetical protein
VSPPTPIEMVLPSGRAANAVVLGAGIPERLHPRTVEGPSNLAIVAPSAEEAGRPGWMDDALARAASAMSPAGMIYLMLPPAQRRTAMPRLADLGYTSHACFFHYPSFGTTESLIPRDRSTLRRWLRSGEGQTSGRRRLASLVLALPESDRVAASLLPSVGIAALRPEAPAPFHWLARLSGAPVVRGLVRAKWRAGRGGAVVIGLDRSGRPVAVAKVALGGPEAEARAFREAERLEQLGPAARTAGAQLPSPIRAELPGGWPVLLLSPISGAPAVGLIRSGDVAPEAVIARLGEWLLRWSEATITPGRLDESWSARELLTPATRLAPDLQGSEPYLGWLRARAAEAAGEPLPTVATHGDLTMSNVLLGDGLPGIVDWEAASARGIPLRDMLYAAVDATAARDGYRDRVASFLRCFPDGSGVAGPLGRLLERLGQSMGLTRATMTLCVHACWLQHAADEQSKRAPGEHRPFLGIVQRLAVRARSGAGTP